MDNETKIRVFLFIGIVVAAVGYYILKPRVNNFENSSMTKAVIFEKRSVKTSKYYVYEFFHKSQKYTGRVGYKKVIGKIGDTCIIEFVNHNPNINEFKYMLNHMDTTQFFNRLNELRSSEN